MAGGEEKVEAGKVAAARGMAYVARLFRRCRRGAQNRGGALGVPRLQFHAQWRR